MFFYERERHLHVAFRPCRAGRGVFFGFVQQFYDRLRGYPFYKFFHANGSPMFHAPNAIADFIYHWYQEPIIERTGYNPVNTLTYALIALLAVYVLWLFFQRKKIVVDQHFVYGVLAFVLLGSTMRIVTDISERAVWDTFPSISPLHAFVYDIGWYDYDAYIIPSPGVYLVTAALLLLSLGILYLLKKPEYLGHVGIALWVPHFLVILPFLGNYALHAIPILFLMAIPAYYVHKKYQNNIFTLVQAGHGLDGAATFYAIDIFPGFTGISYGEQHVVGGFIGELFGTFFAFYLLKVLLAYFIVDALHKENAEENYKNYLALVIMIVGFAPGLRDVLRMMVGV